MSTIMSRRDVAGLPASAQVYVYGTGMAGRRMRAALEERLQRTIAGYVDSFRDGEEDGVPVLRPEQLLARDDDDLIIVVASQHWPDILPKLRGVRRGRVLNGYFLALDLLGDPSLAETAPSLFPLEIVFARPEVMPPGFLDRPFPAHPLADPAALESALASLESAAVADPGGHALLTALRRLIERDLFHAVADLYRWLRSEHAGVTLQSAGTGSPAASSLRLEASVDAVARFADLDGLASSEAEGGLFLEAAGLALARMEAFLGRPADAHRRLTALAARPRADARWAHFIPSALLALDHLLKGEAAPPALAHFVGDDPGYLAGRICAEPFKRFDVQPNGDVLVCCHHWLPTSIGNIYLDTPDEILNSPVARDIRSSMLDGSFKYCNLPHCPLAMTDALHLMNGSPDPVTQRIAEAQSLRVEAPHSVVVAFDQTCNLSCPSCRNGLIIEKGSLRDIKLHAAETVILPLLRKAHGVLLNTAGELFASKPSRHILSHLNRAEFPNLHIDIISNGTLFGEEEWAKFPNIHDMIGYVRISVDAATGPTFEKLRRGGNFERLSRNMAFLARLRREGVIGRLATSFTYQVDNFREMPLFVEWCRAHHVDYVSFEKLENIVFGQEAYEHKAVHRPSHPDHAEFREILRHPMLHEPIVRVDLPLEPPMG